MGSPTTRLDPVKLRAAMEQRRLTTRRLAEQLGLAVGTMRAYARYHVAPPASTAIRIAALLDVDVSAIT